MDVLAGLGLLVAIGMAFAVSASVGLGGSLLMVPILGLAIGTKEGVALAALLLGANNVFKVVAYRQSIPWRASIGVVVLLSCGAAIGALVLVAVAERLVTVAVIAAICLSLLAERRALDRLRRLGGPVLAFGAGLSSGVSGTSGPLKGVALKSLRLDRAHLVGAASVASLFGDVTKASIFADAELLDGSSLWWAVVALPLMPVATLLGRSLNRRVGESSYAAMFWTVMGGYTLRLLFA